jgi:hypothetical protein
MARYFINEYFTWRSVLIEKKAGRFFIGKKIKQMKSLERRFRITKEENSSLSSFVCFAKAIEKQNFNTRIIKVWFSKLVEKEDYSKNDKKDILSFLKQL